MAYSDDVALFLCCEKCLKIYTSFVCEGEIDYGGKYYGCFSILIRSACVCAKSLYENSYGCDGNSGERRKSFRI